MCIAFFLWEHPQLPDLQLVALFNRDEVLGRPTAASHFWQDRPCILGGRDLVAGGTWLCISRRGRAAFLTNFRELRDAQRPGAPSRGALPVDCVTSEAGAEAFLEGLDSEAYPGFNLVGIDLREGSMLYLCNKRGGQVARLPPGLHGVTNGQMYPRWPKVEEGCRQLQQLVERGAFHAASSNRKGRSGRSSVGPDGHDTSGSAGTATASDPGAAAPGDDSGRAMAGSSPCTSAGGIGSASVPWEELFGLLSDDRLLERDPERLPKTGYGAEFEARVSGIFVQPVDTPWGPFGTRSKIVLAVWRDGSAELREEYLAQDGSWQQVQHAFRVCTHSAGCSVCGASRGEAIAQSPDGRIRGQDMHAQQQTG